MITFAQKSRKMNGTYAELAQMELWQAASSIQSEEDYNEMKRVLSLFFAQLAQREIDKLWDDGILDQAKLDELRKQHLRTPYK